MMDLIILLAGDADIQAAFERMDDDRGQRFLQRLDGALGLLRRHPMLGSRFGPRYRRLLIKPFPHGIFYDVQATRIVVSAVMDLRQDPRSIWNRLYGA